MKIQLHLASAKGREAGRHYLKVSTALRTKLQLPEASSKRPCKPLWLHLFPLSPANLSASSQRKYLQCSQLSPHGLIHVCTGHTTTCPGTRQDGSAQLSLQIFYLLFLFFPETISLCYPGWPQTHEASFLALGLSKYIHSGISSHARPSLHPICASSTKRCCSLILSLDKAIVPDTH